MIPKTDPYKESFEEYMEKWPTELKNFPAVVIKQWCYEHNEEVIEYWEPLINGKWAFKQCSYIHSEIEAIGHLDGRIQEIYNRGARNLTHPNGGELAMYMREHQNYPVPLIVARDSEHVLHPRGTGAEYMNSPLQLLEGERRLGFLLALLAQGVGKKNTYEVVEVKIPL